VATIGTMTLKRLIFVQVMMAMQATQTMLTYRQMRLN
jgi:hypothetical protein